MSTLRNLVLTGVFAAAVLLGACEPGLPPDPELTARLVGNWSEIRQLDNERHEQQMQLDRDGTFVVTGVKLEEGVVTRYRLQGAWRVHNGYFWYKTVSSEPPDFFPPGEEFKDRIVSVTDSGWIMIEESTGQKSYAQRQVQ